MKKLAALLPKNPTPEEVQKFIDALKEQRQQRPVQTAAAILPEEPEREQR